MGSPRVIAAVTGAGISSESGIPTFRGPGGLWRNFRAEELATPEAFRRDPVLVWEWYDWRRGICAKAAPNPAHIALAELDSAGDEFLLITQNVDGLHRRAGSKRLLEIHGNIWRARCTSCRSVFDLMETPLEEIPPRCECGGLARPDILWFGESYDSRLIGRAFDFLTQADLVLVIGTSGMVPIPVQMAAHARSHGARIVDFNTETSAVSDIADEFVIGPAGQTLPDYIRNLGP